MTVTHIPRKTRKVKATLLTLLSAAFMVASTTVHAGVSDKYRLEPPPTSPKDWRTVGKATKEKLDDVAERASKAQDKVSSGVNSLTRTLDELRTIKRLSPELEAYARKVIDGHDEFLASLSDFEKVRVESIKVFSNAAAAFRRCGEAEKYSEIKALYFKCGDLFLVWKQRFEDAGTRLPSDIRMLNDNREYVEATVLFISRLRQAVEVVPEGESIVLVEAFIAENKEYISRFTEFRDTINRMHETVKGEVDILDKSLTVPTAQKEVSHHGNYTSNR